MAAGQGGRARNPPKRRRPTGRNTDLDLLRVLVLLLFVIAIVIAIGKYGLPAGTTYNSKLRL